jgi:CheY-like chemotaxis protein
VDDIVAVVTDLFFQARITAAARAAGRRVRFVASPQALGAAPDPALSLVDLDARTDVMEMIHALKRETRSPVVAFGPHLDTERRKAARSAGADRVLAKSKFTTELPRLMNNQQKAGGTAGEGALEAALAEMRSYGQRMEELGKLFQDPDSVGRIYFAPEPHMEEGDPIVLDSADYLDFLAVETLRPKLERIRALRSQGGASSA